MVKSADTKKSVAKVMKISKKYKQKSEYDTLKSMVVNIQKQLNERDTKIVELEKKVKAQ